MVPSLKLTLLVCYVSLPNKSPLFIYTCNLHTILFADDYEHVTQYAHGVKREAQGSSFFAYFNIVCVVCGMGALQLPFALKQGGWIGLLILFLSWFFSTCKFLTTKSAPPPSFSFLNYSQRRLQHYSHSVLVL